MAGSWRPRTVPSRVTIILLPSALHNLLTLHEELRKRRTEQCSRRHPWKNSRCSFERSRARSLERSNAKRMRKPEAIVHPTSNATTQAHGLLRQIDGEMRIVLDVWNTKTTSSNICRMRNQVTRLDARIRMRGERERANQSICMDTGRLGTACVSGDEIHLRGARHESFVESPNFWQTQKRVCDHLSRGAISFALESQR